jgi:general nucleoside transport system ATP-binding protein
MTEAPILLMKDVQKSFDKSKALDNVHFDLDAKEIHGLLGGNGAGKTTLMNILFGLYRMDSGEIILHDKKIEINSPKDAIQNRIGMVHQHFLQITSFSVLENIILGTDIKNRYTMNLDEEIKKIRELAKRFSLDVDLNAIVEDLPMGIRQKVEILKTLYRGVEILILDEPTTNLTPQEVEDLFQSLRVMVNEGMSIVFITHKLREVLSVCDRITVLRNGKNVCTMRRSEATEEEFVRGMVGDEMNIKDSVIFSHGSNRELTDFSNVPVMLSLDKVNLIDSEKISRLKDVSLTIHEGEIMGVAGVAGNGQKELAEIILGVQPATNGKVEFLGASIVNQRTSELLKQGISYIPEDRLHDGFLPKASVAHNLILGYQREQPYSNGQIINWNVVFDKTRELIEQYHVKTKGPHDPGGNLSGGNIQRVMIARAFSRDAKLVIAHNPTRGLDIPSMNFVYTKMLEHKAQKMSNLLISEDLDELLLICDRIAVIYRGEILGILDRPQFEKYEIGRLMSGIRKA